MQDIHFRRHYVRHLPKEVSQNDIIKAGDAANLLI